MADLISFRCEGIVVSDTSDLLRSLLQDFRKRELADIHGYLRGELVDEPEHIAVPVLIRGASVTLVVGDPVVSPSVVQLDHRGYLLVRRSSSHAQQREPFNGWNGLQEPGRWSHCSYFHGRKVGAVGNGWVGLGEGIKRGLFLGSSRH